MDDDAAALALVGTTVADKYCLISLLGAGGMGAVYEAEHVFTKRRVALKRMHHGIARSKHAADRFIREAQAPSTIGHPGIVQVLDGGFDPDGSLYLVLELLEGVSMEEALEQSALEAPALLQIGIELLEALGAAHAKGFIHRDIKPDNVFLADDGRGGVTVKLLDFGIASLHTQDGNEKLTKTGSVLGTPVYMSPEQAQGAAIDARSDLWSVGAMLYRAFAGRAAYEGDTYNALIVSIVTQDHPPLSQARPDLPASLLDIVERALRKKPSDRFATAQQMCDALKLVSLEAGSAVVPRKPAAAARGVTGPALRPATGARQAAVAKPAATTVESGVRRGPPRTVSLVASVGLCAALAVGLLQARSKGPASRDERVQLSAVNTESAQRAEPTPVNAAQPSPTSERKQDPVREPAPIQPTATAPATVSQPVVEEPRAKQHSDDGLPPEALSAAIAKREPELQHCLEEAVVAQMLAGSAKAEPLRLDITLNVAQTGRVSDVQAQGNAPSDLIRCVRTSLAAAQFPAAAAPTVFRYPLVLAPTIMGR